MPHSRQKYIEMCLNTALDIYISYFSCSIAPHASFWRFMPCTSTFRTIPFACISTCVTTWSHQSMCAYHTSWIFSSTATSITSHIIDFTLSKTLWTRPGTWIVWLYLNSKRSWFPDDKYINPHPFVMKWVAWVHILNVWDEFCCHIGLSFVSKEISKSQKRNFSTGEGLNVDVTGYIPTSLIDELVMADEEIGGKRHDTGKNRPAE